MHENLPRLVHELRQETCPKRVITEVTRRISAGASSRRPFRYRIALSGAAVALLGCLLIWRWPTAIGPQSKATPLVARTADRAELARQAGAALELIGGLLVDAGARCERTIYQHAVPQLRNSFDSAKQKTIDHLKL